MIILHWSFNWSFNCCECLSYTLLNWSILFLFFWYASFSRNDNIRGNLSQAKRISQKCAAHAVSSAWSLQCLLQHLRVLTRVTPMPRIMRGSRREDSLEHGRRFSTPPTSQYCTRAYPDRAFSRGNMILRTRRHAPRLTNGVKIAARRCASRVSKRAALHVTRARVIAARTVLATDRTDESAHWLNAFDQRGITRAQRTLVGECSRRSETSLHYLQCNIAKYRNTKRVLATEI